MESIVSVVGIVSGIASVVALFLPAAGRSWRIKVIHAIYCLGITILAGATTSYYLKTSRARRAERAAVRLSEQREMDFTSEGFVQAVLAYLEANRTLYPAAYARAEDMCKRNGCADPAYGAGTNALDKGYNMISLAHALDGILKGIAAVENTR